jgi:archaellum component FlaF (FlaF/FlaG flagellin family)
MGILDKLFGKKEESTLEAKINVNPKIAKGIWFEVGKDLIDDKYGYWAIVSAFSNIDDAFRGKYEKAVKKLAKNEDVLRAMYDSLLRKAKVALYKAGKRYGLNDELKQIFDENSGSAELCANLTLGVLSKPSSKGAEECVEYARTALVMAGVVGALCIGAAELNGKDVSERVGTLYERAKQAFDLVSQNLYAKDGIKMKDVVVTYDVKGKLKDVNYEKKDGDVVVTK